MLRRAVALLCAGAWLHAAASAFARGDLASTVAGSRQLIVVVAPDWNANHGTLGLFERAAGGAWERRSPDVPVMLGRNGLAWGVGLHPQAATKREGDGRSPAGVFELERIYGRDARAPSSHFPYRQLRAGMEGVDDPRSRFYNRLVDPAEVSARDWAHSEKVRPSNPMFRWCVEVGHNWAQRPGLGLVHLPAHLESARSADERLHGDERSGPGTGGPLARCAQAAAAGANAGGGTAAIVAAGN